MIEQALLKGIERRKDWISSLGSDTTCLRLLHGAAEGVPGLTVDRYGDILLVQTWGSALDDDVPERLAETANAALGVELTAVWNHRAKGAGPYSAWHDPPLQAHYTGQEHGLSFDVRPRHRGKDPLLFVDFRVGRRRVRQASAGASVLNLFAYTCGIGIAAKAGGAASVLNVDFAASALEVGRTNAELNDVEEGFEQLHFDALPVLRALAGLGVKDRRGGRRLPRPPVSKQEFDLVVLDPPRWARSKYGAVDVVRDYQSLFKPAVLATKSGGKLLATNHVPGVDRSDWVASLKRCAAKAGRPLGDVELLSVDEDVPSFDGDHPLKLAWCTVV